MSERSIEVSWAQDAPRVSASTGTPDSHWRPEHEAGGVLRGECCEQLDDLLGPAHPNAEHERTV
jgi:hypothetical protein